MTYLVQKYGKDDSLYPKDFQQRALVDKMLYFDIGVLYKSIIGYWVRQRVNDYPFQSGCHLYETVITRHLKNDIHFRFQFSSQNPQIYDGQPADSQKANVLKQSLEYLDLFLKDDKYICGDRMTVADFSIVASVTTLDTYDYDYGSCVHVKKWVERLKSEIPYFSECVTSGVEIAKTWVKTILRN